MLTPKKAKALAGALAAFLGACLTQPDVTVPPIAKLGIVAVLALLAAANWDDILS